VHIFQKCYHLLKINPLAPERNQRYLSPALSNFSPDKILSYLAHFRRDKDIPLVVPEVNPHAIAEYTQRNIIANPNCSTIQMLVALKPIYDAVGIERINVATYQAVSGSGKEAISELIEQTTKLLSGNTEVDVKVYPKQIAFNVVPHIDVFQDNGYTKEEMKMVWETQKIFEDDNILVNPTAVRVPVIYGHSEAINIETKTKITAAEATEILSKLIASLPEPDTA
jgi:aspartate-semialdehyde dehydrogenase